MEQLKQILKYLDGEVTGEEKQMFEKELMENGSLKQTFNLVKDVNSTIADDNLLSYTAKLKQTQDKVNKENNSKPKINLTPLRILAVASAIIILVILAFYYSNTLKPSNEKVFAQFYQRYEADIITRSSEPADGNDLINAIQLYDKGNYTGAISRFEAIIKNDATNTAARFFIGVSFIETKNYSKAIENLKMVINQNDTVFMEHAEWYLALCYVKTNQTSQAYSILKKIANGRTYYRVMASDILKKIK